jgi:hypothetical protein
MTGNPADAVTYMSEARLKAGEHWKAADDVTLEAYRAQESANLEAVIN